MANPLTCCLVASSRPGDKRWGDLAGAPLKQFVGGAGEALELTASVEAVGVTVSRETLREFDQILASGA